jgi:AAA15 family ATPase/GTPase
LTKEYNINKLQLPEDLKQDLIRESANRLITVGKDFSIHLINGKEYQLDIEKESMGTRSFISILYLLYKAIKQNSILFLDEILSFLHPSLTREIINIVKNECFN